MEKIKELWNKIPTKGKNIIAACVVVALFFLIIGIGVLIA